MIWDVRTRGEVETRERSEGQTVDEHLHFDQHGAAVQTVHGTRGYDQCIPVSQLDVVAERTPLVLQLGGAVPHTPASQLDVVVAQSEAVLQGFAQDEKKEMFLCPVENEALAQVWALSVQVDWQICSFCLGNCE